MPASVDLITISREYGSGASELAAELGSRLGWRVLDRDLVQLVADKLSLDHGAVETRDERPPSFFAKLISIMLLVRSPDHNFPIDTADMLNPDDVAIASREVISEAAKTPPLIVVGHGAQCLFALRPNTLHLRLVASLESRLDRIRMRKLTALHEDPQQVATQIDAARAEYVQRYYGRDVRDPLLYDLQINTGRIPITAAAQLVVQHVRNSG